MLRPALPAGPARRRPPGRLLFCFAAAVLFAGAEALAQCPTPTGRDFSRQTLTDQSFASQDLRGANFTQAVLDGTQFVNANLAGAVFAGASIRPTMKSPPDFTGADLTGACFQGATLQEPDLQFANLACADFSGTDVTRVDFGPAPKFDPGTAPCGRVTFARATMRVRQVPFRSWRFTNFTHTDFTDLTAEEFSFAGLDITGALLAGGRFGGIDFTKATLEDVDLTDSDLRGAKLDGAKALRIHLDGSNFRLGTAPGADFTGATMRRLIAQDAQLPGAVLDSAILRGASFAGANLRQANLQRAFLDPAGGLPPTELAGANLNSAKLDNAHISFVSFRNVRMVAATLTKIKVTDTDFSGAILPGADFSDATLEGVSFRGASLENASFVRTSLGRSKTTGKSLDLACTQLGGADLRSIGVPTEPDSLTFLGAVLPDRQSCRPEGNGFFCGTELASQKGYGPTLVPDLETYRAICPAGESLPCKDETWLLPGWTTTACGLPQKRWTPPPPRPGPPGETVEIPDEKFRLCLSRQFFGDDRPIPTKFAETVQEINCTNMDIADVTGLEAFRNLRKLTLTANRLTSGDFGKLKNLEILEVDANALTTLNVPLATLKSLRAGNNRLQRVTGLAFVQLEYLDLSRNELAAFPLDGQRQLSYADLSHNRLTDVGDLSHDFRKLTYLYLQNNDLTTIGTLEEATLLAHLGLGSNPKFRCGMLKVDPKVLEKSNCRRSAITASASPATATSRD